MRACGLVVVLFASSLALLSAPAVLGGPQDTRVGETRVIYSKAGTAIRADAAMTAAPVATLPQNTNVVVEEVKLPWVKVRATVPGQQPVSGWLRAYEAIEPSALTASPGPAYVSAGAPPPGVNARDVSAASRQFTSDTEKGYRANHRDMERGYQMTDALEAATARMTAADGISFLMEGDLGRRGRDYQLPGRVPPTQDSWRNQKVDAGDAAGKVIGGLRGLGVKIPKGADTAAKVAGAFAGLAQQLNSKFTPEQEYYLGRAVAATALAQYGPDPDENRRRYVRQIGDAIVRVADPRYAPPNFGGYHFEVLNCDEVNGVSGPGGYILVTRGAVNACKTEDELAGILCHELAHVALGHGEAQLRKSKEFQGALKAFGSAIGALTGADSGQLTGHMVDLFGTAVSEMGRNAVSHGYDRELEFQADATGTQILYDVFYDWTKLRDLLARMGTDPHTAAAGASHASPAQRASSLDSTIAQLGPVADRPGTAEARKSRFETTLRMPTSAPR